MRVVDLYHDNAAAWVELRGRRLIEKNWLDLFVEAMPPEGRDVLDLGCGSGRPIADYLIEKGLRITGVDGAAALVDMARASFPEQTWIVADMRDLPAIGPFHGLIAWHSFFHLTPGDQRSMFGSFRRLCHPGAALLFTSGTRLGEAFGRFQGEPLYHASLDGAEYRRLLHANGFETVRHVANDPTCGDASIWLARKTSNGR